MYIARNLIHNNYDPKQPYFPKRFQKITQLGEKDLFTWYERCADLGNNECLYQLGNIYEYGKYNTPIDYEKSLSYYKKISIPNYNYVQSHIDALTEQLNSFNQLIKESAKGNVAASYTVADAYKNGNYGQKVDKDKWLEYLELSAKGGDKFIIQELIRYYSQKSLIDKNKDKLLHYYNLAIENGDQQNAYMLAMHYYDGSQLVNADRQKAREYLVKSGSQGKRDLAKLDNFDKNLKLAANNSEAAYQVGYAYFYGNGIHQNELQAKQYLQQAAKQGHHEAIYLYSKLLQVGCYNAEQKQWIIEPNWQEAVNWLEKIPNEKEAKQVIHFYHTVVVPAQNGNADSMYDLASWYSSHNNLFTAGEWFQKSAQSGNLRALQGVMMFSQISKEEKQALLLKGAQQGDLYSRDKLANIIIESPEIASDSAQYQLAIQFLEDNLNSDDKSFSRDAYFTLKYLYHDGYTLGDGKVIRQPSQANYIKLLEAEADKRRDAVNSLYYFYVDNDVEKALSYLDKEYPNDELGVTEKRYFAYFPRTNCSNKNADADKAGHYLKEWLDKSNAADKENRNRSVQYQLRSKNMGDIYLNGQCNIPKNIDKAIEWYNVSLSYDRNLALDGIYNAYLEKGDIKKPIIML